MQELVQHLMLNSHGCLIAGRADLAVMARPHLRDPYLTLRAAEAYGRWDHEWPGQYLPARPREPKTNQRKSD